MHRMEADTITYSAAISACEKGQRPKEALQLLRYQDAVQLLQWRRKLPVLLRRRGLQALLLLPPIEEDQVHLELLLEQVQQSPQNSIPNKSRTTLENMFERYEVEAKFPHRSEKVPKAFQ